MRTNNKNTAVQVEKPREWVTIKKCAERTGISELGIRSRIKRGDWRDGTIWVKREGRVFLDMVALYEWIESGVQ